MSSAVLFKLGGRSRVFSMKATKEELIDIIYQSLEEVNEQLPNEKQIQKSPDATLVGRTGGLDSLGFDRSGMF